MQAIKDLRRLAILLDGLGITPMVELDLRCNPSSDIYKGMPVADAQAFIYVLMPMVGFPHHG